MLDDPVFVHHRRLIEEGIALLQSKGCAEALDFQTQLDACTAAAQPGGNTQDYTGHLTAIGTLLQSLIKTCRATPSLQSIAQYLERKWHDASPTPPTLA